MKKTLFVISIFIFFIKIVKCSEDWVAFEDEKCFKFVNRAGTREEAEQICNNQAKDSPTLNFLPNLVSIKSHEEQQFLERYLFETSNALSSVWISAKRLENTDDFEWSDGSELVYDNWAEGHPTNDKNRKCVQMQSLYNFKNSTKFIKSSTVGKWVDVPCEKFNLVLCGKLQTWSFSQLQKAFLDTKKELKGSLEDVTKQLSKTTNLLNDTLKELEDTKNQLSSTKNELTATKNELTNTTNHLTTQLNEVTNKLEGLQKNPVPIGFIYVQLPAYPEPRVLWPTVVWGDVSSQFAGLFFRVEGRGSVAFGAGIQEENSPRLNRVRASYINNIYGDSYIVANGSLSHAITSGSNIVNENYHLGLSFQVSSGEVRPRNQAVRIWKRTI